MDTIHVKQGRSGKWYYRIEHTNGQCLATSQTYSSKEACVDSAKALFTRHSTTIKLVVDQ
jgi:uncharacterized protein YegP (UPF0339 family)